MTGAQIIVVATPIFLALIALEIVVGRVRGRNGYRLHDALASIGLGVMSQIVGLFTAVLTLGAYVATYEHFAIWRLPIASPWTWAIALVVYDFLYYWYHRAGHRVALLWAAHAVHHQSEHYNLSTALRQTASGWLVGWIFFLPMAVAGFPPLVVGTVALIDLLYQFWVHTEQVGRLGWFDRWFCAPSNHRVHHSVNDGYLDRNFGGVFIVWDRLFGTYAEEDDAVPCVYGTRAPLRSWNPLRANLQVYAELARDSWRTRRWTDKLRVWLNPPGWRPDDVAERWPKSVFDLAAFEPYRPTVATARSGIAMGLFALVLIGATLVLWHAHTLSRLELAGLAAALGAGLCLIGWLGEPGQPQAPVTSRPRTCRRRSTG